jgi:pimeloyl-ACP methyl ester carboxylesterase
MNAERRRAWAVALCGLPWLALFGAVPAARAEEETLVETVVLLHGLLRTERSMRKLETHLEGAGYRVENIGYPSRDHTPDELVEELHAALTRCCQGASRVHFVTHSLGGILLRAYLVKHELPHLGRVVMLAPPNRGSEHVDRLRDWALFRWVFGPTGAALGSDPESLPNRLPPVSFELGVIAGTKALNPLGPLLPEGNDGTVTLGSAQVEGMRDFVAIPASHTFIMNSDLALDLTLEFLRSGRFAPR